MFICVYVLYVHGGGDLPMDVCMHESRPEADSWHLLPITPPPYF